MATNYTARVVMDVVVMDFDDEIDAETFLENLPSLLSHCDLQINDINVEITGITGPEEEEDE
jgi:hypothetical protein